MTNVEISQFLSELALLLESDISCRDALEIIQKEQESFLIRRISAGIQTDIENGMSLADSFARRPRYFEPFMVDMLREAESLNITLAKIADYRESLDITEHDLTEKIALSSSYFIAVIFIGFFITSVILIYVVPVFADMLAGFRANLPIMTQLLVEIADFVIEFAWFLTGFFLILITLLWIKRRSIIFYMPLFGKIYQKITLVRLLRTCGFALSNKTSLVKALEAASQAVKNPIYGEPLQQVIQEISSGMPLSDALKKQSIFPEKVIHAAIVGTKNNSLDKLLNKIADIYTKQVIHSIEPTIKVYTLTITILLGIIVGFLVISLYAPIFMMGSVVM